MDITKIISIIQTIVPALLVFGILIMVHEAGHFFVAKAVGIKIDKFAIGMGPVILKKTKGETEYSVRLLPIGGYVKMEGEDEESDHERSFTSKTIPQKIAVSAAGSAMNFILAVLIIIVIFIGMGFPSTTVSELIDNKPAQQAGMMAGDEIIQINDIKIKEWADIQDAIGNSNSETIDIIVLRDGIEKSIVSGVTTEEDGRRVIGIMPESEKRIWLSIVYGFKAAIAMVGAMFVFLGELVRGKAETGDVVGPVGIIYMVGEASRTGWYNVLGLGAMISMNLAIINLLPFPALDGGRIILLIIQGITGKKIPAEKEGWIHFAGFVLLMITLILVTYRDVGKFILGR